MKIPALCRILEMEIQDLIFGGCDSESHAEVRCVFGPVHPLLG